MKTKQVSRERLMELLAAVLDGVDGYESETGYLRYWDAKSVADAREVVKQYRQIEVQRNR